MEETVKHQKEKLRNCFVSNSCGDLFVDEQWDVIQTGKEWKYIYHPPGSGKKITFRRMSKALENIKKKAMCAPPKNAPVQPALPEEHIIKNHVSQESASEELFTHDDEITRGNVSIARVKKNKRTLTDTNKDPQSLHVEESTKKKKRNVTQTTLPESRTTPTTEQEHQAPQARAPQAQAPHDKSHITEMVSILRNTISIIDNQLSWLETHIRMM